MWMNDTPVGRLLLAGNGESLSYVIFDNPDSAKRHSVLGKHWQENARPFREVVSQLNAYFRGKLTSFDVPLAGEGTEFQQAVWNELQNVPHGETRSYGQIANAIGKPTASRAVGMANGRNPISIIVPCHRIIGSSGKLVGYGGGLQRKITLLRLEGVSV